MNTTAGWYPVNGSRELGYFDGTDWTGDRVANPDAPAPRSGWAKLGFVVVLAVALLVWGGFEAWVQWMAG